MRSAIWARSLKDATAAALACSRANAITEACLSWAVSPPIRIWSRVSAAIAAIRSRSATPRAADASRTASPNQLSEISITASRAAAASPP